MRVTWIAKTNHDEGCSECERLVDELLDGRGLTEETTLDASRDSHAVTLQRALEQTVPWGD